MAVDRIGTNFNQSQLLTELMRQQSRIAETQRQVSTGKVGETYADLGGNASLFVAAKTVQARLDAYQEAGTALKARLDIQASQLNELSKVATDMRTSVATALATGDARFLMEELSGRYNTLRSILNTERDGTFFFGGTRGDAEPVTAATLADLGLLAAGTDAFQDSGSRTSAVIGDNQTIDSGQPASVVAGRLFEALRVLQAAATADPFGGELTAAQRTTLETALGGLSLGIVDVQQAEAVNGLAQSRLETTTARNKEFRDAYQEFISGIEDVDVTEAISRLSRDQLAVEASTRVLAQLYRSSLLDVLQG